MFCLLFKRNLLQISLVKTKKKPADIHVWQIENLLELILRPSGMKDFLDPSLEKERGV